MSSATAPTDPQARPQEPTWSVIAGTALFSLFCFELGAFLTIYPWLTIWSSNWFFHLNPGWYPFLISQEFRGAVSGLGVLNVMLGFYELYRFFRMLFRGVGKRASATPPPGL